LLFNEKQKKKSSTAKIYLKKTEILINIFNTILSFVFSNFNIVVIFKFLIKDYIYIYWFFKFFLIKNKNTLKYTFNIEKKKN